MMLKSEEKCQATLNTPYERSNKLVEQGQRLQYWNMKKQHHVKGNISAEVLKALQEKAQIKNNTENLQQLEQRQMEA